jgi:DNA-binding NarL/FixJ family response regulator
MEVVGIAIRSEGLAAQVRACRPDVLLLDWNLVTQPASDYLSRIRSLAPQLKIVVLHVHPEIRQAVESAGADVFISKDTPPDELLMVLRKMRKDELRSLH